MEEKNKNLATCTPREFLKQTNRIRKSAERWMNITDILNIRNRKVEGLKEIPKNDDAEAARIRKENVEKVLAQRTKNMNDILDAALEKHVDETLEVLALALFKMCFYLLILLYEGIFSKIFVFHKSYHPFYQNCIYHYNALRAKKQHKIY